MTATQKCAECGAELARDAPEGLCPQCLLKRGLVAPSRINSEARTVLESQPPVLGQPPPASPPPPEAFVSPPPTVTSSLAPGQQFGPYRIIRLLGKGGMGEVYEADHLESERRVAIKILNHALDAPETRKRFLREGRLAASVNHPNIVYIFGTEEIDGIPVIAMEYVPAGTLKDQVKAKGPLPVAEAVDMVLQIIDGLEAAQAKGVLHRDIKPANCFLDTDGTVKVGDFGLSISTLARTETSLTVSGAVLGTPAYASPEQMRGDELDVRSDIYSLGVTLYYLLTGRPPFEGDNLVKLLAAVLEHAPESPRKWRPEISKDLANVVLRCLEKQPAARFTSYAQLRKGLFRFSSTAPAPARPGRRFVADIIDTGLLTAFALAILTIARVFIPSLDTKAFVWHFSFAIISVLGAILYYGLLEGLCSATVGKAICRLMVVAPNRNAPGLWKGVVRASIFGLPVLPFFFADAQHPDAGTWLLSATLQTALFCTMRRRNGYAAIHDLITHTRVINTIHQPTFSARPKTEQEDVALPEEVNLPRLGPYHVLASLSWGYTDELLLGFDSRLLRKVWIRRIRVGTDAIGTNLRYLSRPGRLRWITGNHTAEACWDAYEAPTGKAFLDLVVEPQPWSRVRYWMLDLAEELNAANNDDSLPPTLGLDRIWITAEGRAKLLDFPAPGASFCDFSAVPGREFDSAKTFLRQLVITALQGDPGHVGRPSVARGLSSVCPIPLYARAFLDELLVFPDFESLLVKLKSLIQKPAGLSRPRRFGVVAGCILSLGGLAVLISYSAFHHPRVDQKLSFQVGGCLAALQEYQSNFTPLSEEQAQRKQDLEIFVLGHYQATISAVSSNTVGLFLFPAGWVKKAQELRGSRPTPTQHELNKATGRLKETLRLLLEEQTRALPFVFVWFVGWNWFGIVIFPTLITALLFRGGLLMALFQIAIVTNEGAPASRYRIFWRSLLAWLPAFPMMFVKTFPGLFWIALVLLAIQGVGAFWAVRRPERGWQDRLAGTWLVPR